MKNITIVLCIILSLYPYAHAMEQGDDYEANKHNAYSVTIDSEGSVEIHKNRSRDIISSDEIIGFDLSLITFPESKDVSYYWDNYIHQPIRTHCNLPDIQTTLGYNFLLGGYNSQYQPSNGSDKKISQDKIEESQTTEDN